MFKHIFNYTIDENIKINILKKLIVIFLNSKRSHIKLLTTVVKKIL